MTAFSIASAPELKSADVLANVPGRQRGELFTDLDVALVGRHHETGVGEARDLRAHGVDEGGHGVADARDGDARTEVEHLIAVDVDAGSHPRRGRCRSGSPTVRPALTDG